MELNEKYIETKEGWFYSLTNQSGKEITNSLSIPLFSQKEDAENSAFQWQVQHGYIILDYSKKQVWNPILKIWE